MVLDVIKDMGPEGVKAANELEQLFNKMVAKSGGTFTGATGHRSVSREPDARDGEFMEYTRTLDDGTLEYVRKDPGGNVRVLDSFTP